MLQLNGVFTRYGAIEVLKDIHLEVKKGELVSLLGGNACGKTTTLKTILGLVKPYKGSVEFDGKNITRWSPAQIVRAGISPVLEGRRIFPYLSVFENLLMGAHTRRDRAAIPQEIEAMFSQFPVLRERKDQAGGTLSGGEQQMLAMARALLARPQMLIMDEPSMGLSPLYVEKIFEIIQDLNHRGMAIAAESFRTGGGVHRAMTVGTGDRHAKGEQVKMGLGCHHRLQCAGVQCFEQNQ